MPNGHTIHRIRLPDDYRDSLANATPVTPTPYSTLNTTREGILVADFTDDDEDNESSYHSYDLGQIQSIGASVGEDVVRTGETSRLRRRGAVHGRRPQPSYVTLLCGAPLPWRFKFTSKGPDNRQTSNPKSLMQRYESLKSCPSTSQHLSLEFPSTGCRSILTNRAYVSPTHHVYSAQVGLENVAAIDQVYLDEEQRNIVAELLVDSWGRLDWQSLACTNCGNLIGFRYAPVTLDEEGNPMRQYIESSGYTSKERFAFFPSAVTSSKPYDFTTQQHYSNSHYWRYLEPLTTSPNRDHPSESTLQTESRGTIDSSFQGAQPHHRQPISLSQHGFGTVASTVASPFTGHGRADVHFRQPEHTTSLPTRSMSSLASSFDAARYDSWSGGESSHTIRDSEPEQQVDDPWAAWRPDPSFTAADNDQAVGDVFFPEAPSFLRITRNEIATESHPPLASSLEFEPRRLEDGDILRHSDAGSGNAATDLLQGLHTPHVSPIGDEHEQVSSDHNHAFTWANSTAASPPISSPSQQHPLIIHDGGILNLSSVDDSQVHPGLERVHDNLGALSDMIPDIREDMRPTSTIQSSSVSSPVAFNMLLPITSESSTTRGIEATGEGVNETENVALSGEVAAPLDSSSDSGSAIIVPSLVGVDQLTVGTTLPEADIGLLSVDLSNQPSSSLDDSSDVTIANDHMEIPNPSTNSRPIGETQNLDYLIGTTGTHRIRAPAQYHQYTPPVPPLSLDVITPSLPSTPSALSHHSPNSHILLSFVEPVEDGSQSEHVSAELDVSHEQHDIENGFNPNTDVNVPGQVNETETATHQPEPEQPTPMEPGHSTRNFCFLEDRVDDSPFLSQTQLHSSSSSSSSRSLSSSLPRHILPTTPVSRPLSPPSPSSLQEMMSPPILRSSRRMSRHSSYTTSSSASQHRSSSGRSWRTPREFLESPVSAESAENVDNLASRSSPSSSRGSGMPNDGAYAIETQLSVGVSRRVRGHSRPRRRRLSSSSRRDLHFSITSAGSTFRTPPSELVPHPVTSQMASLTPGTQNQLRMGDSLRRLQRLTASPELFRRGSLPNIERPRLSGLVRRDSLPVLSMQREPLSNWTANPREREFRPIVSRLSTSVSNTRSQPPVRDGSPMSNRRHRSERSGLTINSDSSHGYDTGTQEDGSDFEQRNESVNDPENALTPRPRRHATMPVFIPPMPSDSDSETEDVNQGMVGVSLSRGPTLVPWMPWAWCWEDQGRNSSENGLQVDIHTTQATGESDKED